MHRAARYQEGDSLNPFHARKGLLRGCIAALCLFDIVFENVTAENSSSAGAIVGLPEAPVLEVVLRNVKLNARRGLTIGYADVSGSGVTVRADEGEPITEGPGAKVSLR